MIYVIGPRSSKIDGTEVINTTSRSATWSRGLSPFLLGPVECYGGLTAKNVENCWQFSKCYSSLYDVFGPHIGSDGNPTESYFEWRNIGWAKDWADRYPAGKGAKPDYLWWNGKKLSYTEARLQVYIPVYAKSVTKSEAFKKLQDTYKEKGTLALWDFDGYNHKELGRTYNEVFNDPSRKAGHGFVLGAILEGVIDFNGQFI